MRQNHVVRAALVSLGYWLVAGMTSATASEPCPEPQPQVPLRFANIERYIRRCGIRSVDELLPKLPAVTRSRYNLVYESRSTQGASRKNPRVIMYGPDARFILAFNGDPTKAGYDFLETIEYHDTARRFQFGKITFPKPGDKTTPVDFNANPQNCLGCHRNDPRPNWESYPSWPGVYQSVSHPEDGGKTLGVPAHEEADLLEFVRTAPTRPRYEHLLDIEKKYLYPDKNRRYSDYYKDFHPTSDLTHQLTLLNGPRLARLIAESADYAKYRFAILAAIRGCPNIESFIPGRVRKTYFFTLAETREQTHAIFTLGGNEFENGRYGTDLDRISALRYVFEGRSLFLHDWSMNFRGHAYGFVTPVGGGSFRHFVILPTLHELDPTLAPFDHEAFDADFTRTCGLLEQRSFEALR